MNIWHVLGVPPASDADTIRKAYAELAKQYHPEDHPEEFKQLNEAYRQALTAARREPARTEAAQKPPDADRSEPFDDEFEFFDLSAENTDFSHWDQNALDALSQMHSLIERKETRISVWKLFIRSESFSHAMDEPLFIGEFTNYLRQHLYSYKLSLFREIERKYFSDDTRDKTMPPYRQLSKIFELRRTRFKRRFPTVKSFLSYYAIPIIIVAVISLIFIWLGTGSAGSNIDTVYDPPKSQSDYDKIYKTVCNYLISKYSNIQIDVDENCTVDGSARYYTCKILKYDGLTFQTCIKAPYSFSSADDNLMETVLIFESSPLKAYENGTGIVYYTYADQNELKEIAALLTKLPSECAEDYPFVFTDTSKLKVCVLPENAPFPYANITACGLFADNAWLSSQSSALQTLTDKYSEYIVKYAPWEDENTYRQAMDRYLNYGVPVIASIDNRPQTFADVRTENGKITSGDIYRLCQHLNIPFNEEDSIPVVTGNPCGWLYDKQGLAALNELEDIIGIPLSEQPSAVQSNS